MLFLGWDLDQWTLVCRWWRQEAGLHVEAYDLMHGSYMIQAGGFRHYMKAPSAGQRAVLKSPVQRALDIRRAWDLGGGPAIIDPDRSYWVGDSPVLGRQDLLSQLRRERNAP